MLLTLTRGDGTMPQPFGFTRMPRIAVAFAAIWMCGTGAAWAGDGGESLTGLNNLISSLCSVLNITTPCPQLPTITQAVLEIAGLETSPPEMVRALNSVAPGTYVDAGNAAAIPPTPFPLTSSTTPTLSKQLSTLTPLAFVSGWKSGSAAATQLYNSNADTFFYAVASGTSVAETGLTEPGALNFFYDDPSWTISNPWNSGTVDKSSLPLAKFLLPLTVLNSDGVTESAVAATLQYIAPSRDGLPCSASTVTGNFSGSGTRTLMASQIGVNCALVFSPSPISKIPHAIFEVQVPLLVTFATDPPYFYFAAFGSNGPINLSIPSAFFLNVTGFTPNAGTLGPNGMYIGVAPSAAPLCTGSGGTCPTTPPPPAPPPPGVFSLCASLPRYAYSRRLVPSVAAYYVIATDGETLLSAPLPAVSTSSCPF
jgi:hypothetical protein